MSSILRGQGGMWCSATKYDCKLGARFF